MNITTDNINTLPAASAAAVVTLLTANSMCLPGQEYAFHPLDTAAATAFVTECRRVAAGPLALLVVHAANEWSDVLASQGLHVTRGSYLSDTIDLVIGSAGPTKPPEYDGHSLRQLVEAVTRTVSRRGDKVLVPFATLPVIPMAVCSSGREAIALAPTTAHAGLIEVALIAGHKVKPLTDELYAQVISRVQAGETLSTVARSLGLWIGALSRRLIEDGYRRRAKRGTRRAAKGAAAA